LTIALDLQRVALDLLREAGGSMRVQDVVARAVMPSVQVRPVFTVLIAAKKVRLQGDDLYVLTDSMPAPTPPPPKPKAAPPPPPPRPEPAAVKTPEPKPKTDKRRCVRCEELLPLPDFPKRPGMVRAARICEGCLPADVPIGSAQDRERAKLPPTRDQVAFKVPGPDAPPPPPNMEPILNKPLVRELARVMDSPYVLIEIEVHSTVRRYIEQLCHTGLYGKTIEETTSQLVVDAVRKALLGETART
jgi:hypothetical protein